MADVITRPAANGSRGGNTAPTTALGRAFNALANALGVQTMRGRPQYRWSKVVADAEADAAPGASARPLNVDQYAAVAAYWRPEVGATAATIRWWVRTENGHWIVVRTDTDVAPNTEIAVPEVAHRPVVPVITAITGGDGVTLYVAGE